MPGHTHRNCPRFRSPLRFDTPEQLREHRELELLRAAAMPRGTKGRARRIRRRARKLDALAGTREGRRR